MYRTTKGICLLLMAAASISSAVAGEEEDMAAMQRQLNAEVMSQEFDVDDPAQIDAYVKEAMKKDLKPEKNAPTYWRKGYTCADIRYRSYRDYRSCVYYHRYYGYYW